jgi:hypothetical protein
MQVHYHLNGESAIFRAGGAKQIPGLALHDLCCRTRDYAVKIK